MGVVLCLMHAAEAAAAGSTFVAAAIQHEAATYPAGSTPAEIQQANLQGYSTEAVQSAHLGAHIAVFPEFGLLPGDILGKCETPSDMAAYCEPIPALGDPRGVPCNHASEYADSPVLVAASCMAKNASIIVSVNTCGHDAGSSSYYNTQIVMSESGELLAVYRKSHVWFKKCFNEPSTPDLVTFNASFGVEFGMFTCYDILFSTPGPALAKQGIRHFITSDAIPLVGSAADKLWSWRYGSSLVASDNRAGEGGIFLKGSQVSKKLPTKGPGIAVATVPVSV